MEIGGNVSSFGVARVRRAALAAHVEETQRQVRECFMRILAKRP
jgi:hypothetical protein